MASSQDITSSSVVLVTGANGHVAQHIVAQLLDRALASRPRVKATVRSQSSAEGLKKVFADAIEEGSLEIVEIPDITSPGAFDTALNACTHIAHVASPLVVGSKDVENELLKPAIRGTTALLESAVKSETLQSVVVTSSFAAVFDPLYGQRPGYTYTPNDWSSLTYEKMADPHLDLSEWNPIYRGFLTYMGSKKLAEKAAWELHAQHKPTWTLSVINPTYIAGPSIVPLTNGVGSLSLSNGLLWKVISSKSDDDLPPFDFPGWVDVRDTARAHILALERPEANGQRFILAPNRVSYADIARMAREKLGWESSTKQQVLDIYTIESKNCHEIFGIDNWIPLELSIVDLAEQIKAV